MKNQKADKKYTKSFEKNSHSYNKGNRKSFPSKEGKFFSKSANSSFHHSEKGSYKNNRSFQKRSSYGTSPSEVKKQQRSVVDFDRDDLWEDELLPDFEEKESSIFSKGTSSECDTESESNHIIFGRNAVRERIRSGRSIDKIFVQTGRREGSITVIVSEAIAAKIPVIETEKNKLDTLTNFEAHQGIVALAAAKEYCTVDDILKIAEERNEKPFLVIVDGIEDPHNLGAIIRTAEGAGAHGLILPKRRTAGLTPVVAKASAGAIEHLAIAKAGNLPFLIEELKKKNIWVYAAEANGTPYYEADLSTPCAIVLGSEGKGVSSLVRSKCDLTLKIPMYGKINSFNVSCAASVLLCEVARQNKKISQ